MITNQRAQCYGCVRRWPQYRSQRYQSSSSIASNLDHALGSQNRYGRKPCDWYPHRYGTNGIILVVEMGIVDALQLDTSCIPVSEHRMHCSTLIVMMQDIRRKIVELKQTGILSDSFLLFPISSETDKISPSMALVTIVGFPSSGKSRLAASLAEDFRSRLAEPQYSGPELNVAVVDDDSCHVSRSAYDSESLLFININ